QLVAKELERDTDLDPLLLAIHFDRAGENEKAYEYAVAAAERNARHCTIADAEYAVSIALRNTKGKGVAPRAHLALLYFQRRRYAEAERLYSELAKDYAESEDVENEIICEAHLEKIKALHGHLSQSSVRRLEDLVLRARAHTCETAEINAL